jgi:hypothetical protein
MAHLVASCRNDVNPWNHYQVTYGYFEDGYFQLTPGLPIGSKVHHPRLRSLIAPHEVMGRNYSYALANPINLKQNRFCKL